MTEFQNAFALSRSEFDANPDAVKINQIIQAGRYVVVSHSLACCPFTDAILGERNRYISDHATASEALATFEPSENEPDSYFAVHGYVPEDAPTTHTVPATAPFDGDDIPF